MHNFKRVSLLEYFYLGTLLDDVATKEEGASPNVYTDLKTSTAAPTILIPISTQPVETAHHEHESTAKVETTPPPTTTVSATTH